MRIRRVMRSAVAPGLSILLVAAFSAALGLCASPAADARSDSGTFILKWAGKEYGVEKFSLEFGNKQVTAQSDSQIHDPGTGQAIRTNSKLVLNTSLEPQSYTWSDKGAAKFDLNVDFTAKPVVTKLHRPDGKDDVRTFQLPKDVLVLDNNVTVHYQVLLDRFAVAGGGKQTFQAYIPQSALPGTLTVQDTGTETIPLNGNPTQLKHLVVLSDNAQIDLWVDDANRLQRLYWSAPQIEAVRQP